MTEGAEREALIAELEKEWMAQDKILDYRNWLQAEVLRMRAAVPAPGRNSGGNR